MFWFARIRSRVGYYERGVNHNGYYAICGFIEGLRVRHKTRRKIKRMVQVGIGPMPGENAAAVLLNRKTL